MFGFFKKSKKDLSKDKRNRENVTRDDDWPAKDATKNNHGQNFGDTSTGAYNPALDATEPLLSACVNNETSTNEDMSIPLQNGDAFSYAAAATRKSPHCVKPCGHGTIAISPRVPVTTKKKQNEQTPPESPKFLTKKAQPNVIPIKPPVLHQNGEQVSPPKQLVEESSSEDDDTEKNLINQEAKFQKQLNELNQQLAQRDAEASKLRFQVEELQRDVFTKSAGIDRLQSELQAAHKESEGLRQSLKHIEEEMTRLRKKNSELEDDINSKTESYAKYENETKAKLEELESVIVELKEKIEKLHAQIAELSSEKEKLEKEHSVILDEKEEQKKLIEIALEDALSKKSSVDKKWEEEFEKLRTVSIIKEQQTFEDFEWKLREVEQMCKKKLQEKDKDIEERLQEACKDAELKLKLAEQMMDEVEHLKDYEVEVRKLRGLTEEQERSIQLMTEQQEQMQQAEQNLKEEAKRLRKLMETEKENLQHIQRLHHQELLGKERCLNKRLDEKKTEIAVYWEERLLHECNRLKSELEQIHNEEKAFAMETIRKQKADEFNEHKKKWEEKLQETLKEISVLNKTIRETEEYYKNLLEEQQSKTDREIMELRRLMDKIDMVHHDNYEKMVHSHEEELDTQWANLIYQKSEAIKLVENDYISKYTTLEEQFYAQQKSHEAREVELLKSIDSLKNEIASKNSAGDDLQNNVETLEGGIQVLNCTIRNLQKELADMQAKMEECKNEYETNILQIKKQSGTTIDHLQRKCDCLTKLFEEVRSRYERRESRQEDLNVISDLRQVIAEQEKDLACINEEKRYYQMKLMSLQRSIEEDEEDFVDTEDFEVVECVNEKDSNGAQYYQQSHQANQPHSSISIPPTIPECEDCDES